MARREDYLLSRLLLTDGTVSFEQLSNILLKWHEDSPKTLMQTITDEGVISEEEGRGLMMCIGKLTEQEEEESSLTKLDSFLCQLLIKKKSVAAELVNEYQRRLSQERSGVAVAEALLTDGHIPTHDFIELKKMAEKIFYRRRIVALVRKQERLGGIFRSPGRDEPEEGFQSRVRAGIQRLITDVKADVNKKSKKKKKTSSMPKFFGQYEILEEIASGGMGTVYKAMQKDLGRIVALKVLHEDEETPDRIKRFLREAEAAGKLKHPNIVGIHEVGIFEGRHFFSMDLIDGVPLSVLIQETQNIDLEDFLNIELELARAVHFAHERGVIHRDLKPANVLIDMEGHPQITDFGLAKMLDTHSRLTKSDTIIGTPFYMSPEQTRGENDRIAAHTDVWGLGVILYEMLTKKLPFVGRSSIELYHKINHAEPLPPRKLNAQISREVEYIVMRAMAKEIEDRYTCAKAMADDIEKYLDGEEIVIRESPLYWRQFRRWFRSNKWLVLIAVLAVLFGWLCGWYLLSTAK
jgi:predicted Ser/Thr protein kinase